MQKVTITKRQGETLKAMKDAFNKTGVVPTTKMLSVMLNVSINGAYYHVSALMDCGLVRAVGQNHLELCEGLEVEIKNAPRGICKGYQYKGNKPGRKPYKHFGESHV